MESNEANIHHLGESLIGLQSSVSELGRQNVEQNKNIAEIKEQGNRIFEAVGGNKKLGHKGLAERQEEIEQEFIKHKEALNKKLLEQHKEHLTFKQEYERDKAKFGKVGGFIVAVGIVLGWAFKALLAKLGFML